MSAMRLSYKRASRLRKRCSPCLGMFQFIDPAGNVGGVLYVFSIKGISRILEWIEKQQYNGVHVDHYRFVEFDTPTYSIT